MKVRARETVIVDGDGPIEGIFVAELLAGVVYEIDVKERRMYHGNTMNCVNIEEVLELIDRGGMSTLL